MLLSLSPRSPSFLLPFYKNLTLTLGRYKFPLLPDLPSTMPIDMRTHAFAGNPLRTKDPNQNNSISPIAAVETLKNLILGNTHEESSPNFKVLPFRKGRPMASSSSASIADSTPNWHLGWINFDDCKALLAKSGKEVLENSLVFLGSSMDSEDDGGVVYWAVDVSGGSGDSSLELGGRRFCFVELRTLMVATYWGDASAMGDLAIAGHVSDDILLVCLLLDFQLGGFEWRWIFLA